MKTIEQAAQECAESIHNPASSVALKRNTELIAAAMREVVTQSEKASAFVDMAVRASSAEAALAVAEGALKRWQDVAPRLAQLFDGWFSDGTPISSYDRKVRLELSGAQLKSEQALALIAEARK